MLKLTVLILLAVLLIGAALVRLRPLQQATYHAEDIHPLLSQGVMGHFSVGAGGDIDAPVLDAPIHVVAARLQAIILRTPNTKLFAGNLTPENASDVRRSATYVTRSALWGFPDVTSVQLDQAADGISVSLHGRLVYGKADLGVNEARVRNWLEQLTR